MRRMPPDFDMGTGLFVPRNGIPSTLSAAGRRWPLAAAGRWPLAAGRWTLAAGRWPLAAGRWPLAAGRVAVPVCSWPALDRAAPSIKANQIEPLFNRYCVLIL